jgi:hypothetical protein
LIDYQKLAREYTCDAIGSKSKAFGVLGKDRDEPITFG